VNVQRRRPQFHPLARYWWLVVCAALIAPNVARGAATAATQEIRMWLAWPDRGMEAALREWERRNPGWRVTTSHYIGGQDPQKLMTSIAGGNPPQVIVQDRAMVGEWACRGAFLQLDERLKSAGVNEADFYPAAWKEAVFQDHVYAVPYNIDGRALYYNKALLKEAGFVDEYGEAKPPRDWDELEKYSVALTKRDKHGRITQLGFAPNYGNSWLFLYAWLNGGEFVSPDGRGITMNQKPIVEALDYMVRLYDLVGGIAQSDAFVNATTGEAVDPFLTGQLAMKIDGDWFLNTAAEYAPNTIFGLAPPPPPKGHQTTTWSGGFSLAIPATAKHQDQAFDIVRFLTSEEGFAIWHQANARYAASQGRGFIPRLCSRPKVNEQVLHDRVERDPNLPPHIVEAMRLYVQLLPTCHFRPVTPIGQYLWDQQVHAIDQATRVHQPSAQALAQAEVKVQEKLDQALNARGSAADVGRQIPAGMIVAATILCLLILSAIFVVLARRGRHEVRRDELVAAGGFLAPWLIGFAALTAGPIVASLIFSFCKYDVLHPPQWAGLSNYSHLVDDPLFWKSLANTAYMLIAVPLGVVLGLGIALLLNAEVRGMRIFRTLFYLPAVVPIVASAILWIWVLNPNSGLINSALRLIGIHHTPLWLASPSWGPGSKAGIILMLLWNAGSGMVVWLAGLKGIPRHLYEAASIDGCGPIRKFFNVTLPLLTPYIFFNLVIGVIAIMQIFTEAMVIAGSQPPGGPADSTLFYALHLFNCAFRLFEMGYASALAWVLMVIVLALTLLQVWGSRRWVHYDLT
jgi:ABC-type sugar transport system permease subunit/ABC-type glycerol-3-phosphate transport system substrate-binding protein